MNHLFLFVGIALIAAYFVILVGAVLLEALA